MKVSNDSYLMLLSWKVTVFTVLELFGKKQQGDGAVKFPPSQPHKLGLRNILQQCSDFFINLCLQVSQGKHCFVKYSQILKNSKPLFGGHLVMAFRIIELCKFIVCFVFQNGFRLLYLSRAKLCLNFISSVKLWVVLKFQCIAVGYISKQNRIKARR